MKKSNTKAQKEVLSMKDALDEFKSLKVVGTHNVSKDWRDGIWNYPVLISQSFRKTVPFSYISIFIVLAVCFGFLLQSNIFTKFLKNNSYAENQYTEGMVGAISSFNPLFVSANYVDKAIDSLIFQKFVYIDTNGKPLPGIAKEWSVSTNGLTYTFVIDENQHWQDGSNLTLDDVLFTFNTAISLSKDYHFDSVGTALEGIGISKVDSKTIQFTLSDANPTFFEAISIYIVPQSVLGGIAMTDMPFDSFALTPVGSGKYFIEKTEKNVVYLADNPYDSYEPHLKHLVFRIYPDYASLETALRVGTIDALGSWDSESLSFMKEYPSFGVLLKNEEFRNRIIFFNVRKDNLKDKNIRIGLTYLLNVNELLKDSNVEGTVMQGPYPETSWAFNSQVDYYAYDPAKAVKFLNDSGYTKNADTGYYESKDNKILSLTLSYLDNDLNNRLVSNIVKLLDKEGVVIKPNKLSYDQISQQVIATRDFEMLLYEIETTVDPDQYNLWHSLKVNFPDLNLSGYEYSRVDILLEDARKTTNEATRKTKYYQFEKYLMADAPVIFLYHPTFVFYFDSRLNGINLENVNFSYERYWNIENWYWKY